MSDQPMLTTINGSMLAEAFSADHRQEALSAGNGVARLLARRQWTERFTVQVDGQSVLIPARLHFASDRLGIADSDTAWRFARALQTRSNDGFERQRAARDVMADLQPWAVPFIVALIGEYIVEILDDIYSALTLLDAQTVAAFIVQNEAYWNTTKRRVMSYWDVYYRWRRGSRTRHSYRRDEYVGFKLIDRLEAAAIG
ncbi:hypothetical protein [Sphingomonas sp. BAUL-RG-20F-R05-02]|uniref:hypothetical protein n=1 Tax=Sphingomonas sp. BAUL-RG-20F-R05-02 TaxID=2914830 RepID=UPI001F58B843|nr:hypothetical protein [Sphingomonas sp. BAUL-RG-20F-R05-02]